MTDEHDQPDESIQRGRGRLPGPQGPRTAHRVAWREVIHEYCTKERLAAIYLKMFQLAMSGDLVAMRMWLDRSVGPVKELIELDQNTIVGTVITPDMQVTAMDATIPPRPPDVEEQDEEQEGDVDAGG